MKQLIILAAILGLSFGLHAQTVTKDAQGNYIAVKAPKIDDKPQDTGKTFTDTKGNVFPVYVSKNGKLFVIRTSKTGTQYKQYLKIG
jgi:hypothetical protein